MCDPSPRAAHQMKTVENCFSSSGAGGGGGGAAVTAVMLFSHTMGQIRKEEEDEEQEAGGGGREEEEEEEEEGRWGWGGEEGVVGGETIPLARTKETALTRRYTAGRHTHTHTHTHTRTRTAIHLQERRDRVCPGF